MVRTRMKQRKVSSGAGRDHKLLKARRDNGTNVGYEIRALQSVISDPEASAMSKVSAARTLAELDGRIGRHQPAPSKAPSLSLAVLSRDQLNHELERLRALIDLGLVAGS